VVFYAFIIIAVVLKIQELMHSINTPFEMFIEFLRGLLNTIKDSVSAWNWWVANDCRFSSPLILIY